MENCKNEVISRLSAMKLSPYFRQTCILIIAVYHVMVMEVKLK